MSVKVKELDNFGLGRLEVLPTRIPVEYQPFEVSRFGLGIITQNGFKKGSRFRLHSLKKAYCLKVEHLLEDEKLPGMSRYRLTSEDTEVDMEAVFSRAGCDKYLYNLSHDKPIQNVRFELDPSIEVVAKTFGTALRHTLTTVNISKSGMLLEAKVSDSVPFIENTLLEISVGVHGESRWVNRPLQCLGKVVRCSMSPTQARGRSMLVKQFGVRLIEMSDDSKDAWESTLHLIESDYFSGMRGDTF